MKLTKEISTRLKTFYKSNLVKLFLSKVNWDDKKTGEARSCYVYNANNSVTIKLPHSMKANVDTGQSFSEDGKLTLWLRQMTEEVYDLYVDDGLEEIYLNVDTMEHHSVNDVSKEMLKDARVQLSANNF